ncbi:hypothetical protein OH540_15965 [Streptomyces sp. BPPL-273]|uniref:hypothetical protein n=1 Tax=Streptomyces sp. BPPL-273 TaxID=2987533 RepID=UPI0024AFBEAD|nr:hypothetical protein [Streptomyces sp. BPPL-273]WHM31466.1 hypothetical protein OH540_15965 [Streptomyces sp. BPPL-273]
MPPRQTGNTLGYTLIIPPGWTKIPLREGTGEAIKEICDDAARRIAHEVPKDKLTEARLEIHRRLSQVVRDAQRRDGLDLYIPVEPLHGRIAPASFIVAKVAVPLKGDVSRQDVMTRLVADFDFTEPAQVHETVGVRGERIVPALPEKEIEFPSRHVDYVLPIPNSEGDWIVVSFSTLGDGDLEGVFSTLLVELFDSLMTTFRWRIE